jgi:hypothetical protein
MSKSAQFEQYGQQCARLAESSGGSHRDLMLSLANAWSKLAEQAREEAKSKEDQTHVQQAA